MKDSRLGRYVPKNWDHVEKHPLTAAMLETIAPTPVTVGINWYAAFDKPAKDADGRYWVGKNPKALGRMRGGHCVTQPHNGKFDTWENYLFYNQGKEGACVGFGSSRCISLLNRKKYNPWWMWDHAKLADDWGDTNPGDDNGTSVRAAMDVLRTLGHVPWANDQAGLPVTDRDKLPGLPDEGILSNKWATNIDDLFSVLQNPLYKKLGAIPFVNSWGTSYPWFVWVPCETWERLMKEQGEFTMIVDRV